MTITDAVTYTEGTIEQLDATVERLEGELDSIERVEKNSRYRHSLLRKLESLRKALRVMAIELDELQRKRQK